MDWNKAKNRGREKSSVHEEFDFMKRDAAAQFLAQHEPPKPTRSIPKPMSDVVIYTDGGCEPNPGKGGWGFVVYKKGVEVHFESGGDPKTTNNIMEMTAVLKAIEWATRNGEKATILSDSSYTVNGCTTWRHNWKRRGWKRGGKGLANAELWQTIDEALTFYPMAIKWVKGHAGIRGNERADELSNIGRLTP